MPKFVLTIETDTEAEARLLANHIGEEILEASGYCVAYDFRDFVGKDGELNV